MREIKSMRYAPNIFDCPDIDKAKGIILGACGDLTPERRWEVETKWLMERIQFEHEGLIVDYGCGIGRVARELRNPVLGVDFSDSMRRQALDYVAKPTTFCAASPEMFVSMVASGLQVSGVLTLWVLEHVLNVEPVVDLLMRALRPGGLLWSLDLNKRDVPYQTEGYTDFITLDDGIKLVPMIQQFCSLEEEIDVDVWSECPWHNAGTLRKFRRKG
jgi:SAM-dependent methyltransferase